MKQQELFYIEVGESGLDIVSNVELKSKTRMINVIKINNMEDMLMLILLNWLPLLYIGCLWFYWTPVPILDINRLTTLGNY